MTSKSNIVIDIGTRRKTIVIGISFFLAPLTSSVNATSLINFSTHESQKKLIDAQLDFKENKLFLADGWILASSEK